MHLTDKIYKLAAKVKQLNKLNTEHIEPLPSTGIITLNNKLPHSDGLLILPDPEIDELFTEMAYTIERMTDDCIALKSKKLRQKDRIKTHLVKKVEGIKTL